MKMKKVAIASITIGTMLTMAACSPSADKEAEKKEQVTAQNEGETKTTSTDEASKTTKDTEKETNTSSNEKTDKDAKNTKESSGTENNGKTTKEKETTGKTNEQTTSGKTTDQTTSGKTTKDPKKSVAVKTNVKEVVTLIESLDKQLAANPKLETVNKLGKQINEKWDVIEKELEASHPMDSKTIGQSMYPLIVGAEKEKIDITKMKSLTSKTKKDLNQLLTKLS
ncbi:MULTISPECIES: hypothetical protein [Bacillus cereus group]|uniref:Lipoprotein n=1 Tax=Bacillus toyonensis TaxID=155322 RepID=A0ABX6G9D2_9BACI|nr:hypothetical protein [Bacillus toyonensis]MED2710978.1 hypothetical protein [Bacillus toyonensis]MED2739509.1 hypothetical protein [Bacillus toyonensis]PDZ28142.1 hypothetical protein CON85_13700 [Bacillus toyonensis]PFX59780.1 hypothetical protein COL34_04085 [Bacillus toyonensis]PHF33489.1 hypothetical protein COF85_24435 [Bacillus toyonensis]